MGASFFPVCPFLFFLCRFVVGGFLTDSEIPTKAEKMISRLCSAFFFSFLFLIHFFPFSFPSEDRPGAFFGTNTSSEELAAAGSLLAHHLGWTLVLAHRELLPTTVETVR